MKIGKHELSNPVSALYNEANLPNEIRRSLNFILMGNLFGNLYGIICGSGTTAMVGLATTLKANDLAFGIITAIMQVAAVMQIPFSILVNRYHHRKVYMLTIGLFSRMLWLVFGLIPIIFPQTSWNLQLWMLIILLGISSCMGSIINVCWFPWLSDLCPGTIQSRWFSIREVIMAAFNMLTGLGVAYLLDYLPLENRYIIIFLIGGVLGMLDMICFSMAKEVYSAPPKKINMKEIVRDIWKNKSFRNLTIMWTMWCFTWNFDSVYMTPYSMNYMGLSAMQIMVFGTMIAAIATMFFVNKWGKAIFHFGGRNVMLISCVGASLTHLFYIVAVPGSVIPTLLFNLIGAAFWSGCNLAANSMQLSCSPDSLRPSYIAMFSCITCVVGTTLGSLAGGWLLDWWAAEGWFTGWFDRYKVLFLIGTVIRTAGVLLLVPTLEVKKNKSITDLVRAIFRIRK